MIHRGTRVYTRRSVYDPNNYGAYKRRALMAPAIALGRSIQMPLIRTIKARFERAECVIRDTRILRPRNLVSTCRPEARREPYRRLDRDNGSFVTKDAAVNFERPTISLRNYFRANTRASLSMRNL